MRTLTIFPRRAFAAALIAGLWIAGSAWAQAPPTAAQAVGSVIGMATLNEGGKPVIRISLVQDDGRIVTIEACPLISSNGQNLGFGLGDRILAAGEMTTVNGVPLLESCDIRLVSQAQVTPQPQTPPSYPSGPDYYYPDYSAVYPDYGYAPYYPDVWYTSPFLFGFNPFFGSGFFFGHRGFDGDFDRDDFRHGFGGGGGHWNHSGTTGSSGSVSAWHGSAGTTGTSGEIGMSTTRGAITSVTPMIGSSRSGTSGWAGHHSVSPPTFGGASTGSTSGWHEGGGSVTHFSAPATHFSSSATHFSAPAFHASGGGGGGGHFSGGGGHMGGSYHR